MFHLYGWDTHLHLSTLLIYLYNRQMVSVDFVGVEVVNKFESRRQIRSIKQSGYCGHNVVWFR